MGIEGLAVNGESRRRDRVLKAIRLFTGLVALVAVLYFVDLSEFVSTLGKLEPAMLCALIGVALFNRCLRAWSWNLLLHAQGIRLGFWQVLRLSLISHFAGAWTPGQLGADAYRVLALRPFGQSTVVFSTVLIERYVGLCAVSVFVLATLPVTLPYLYQVSPWVLAIVVAAILAVGSVVPCLFSRRMAGIAFGERSPFAGSPLGQKVASFYETLMAFRDDRATLVLYFVVTLVQTALYFVVNYLSARALGLEVSLVYFFLAMPLVHLLLRIPISLQGLGIQEGCFAYAMVVHGFTAADGLAVSVVQRALEWVLCILPGGILLWLTSGPRPNVSSSES